MRGGSASAGAHEDAECALVRQLYAQEQPAHVVVHCAGAGGQLAAWLLSQPGASSMLLELSIPYSRQAVDELLGAPPAEGYCAAGTAQQLARAAHRRAVALRFGSAALVSDYEAASLQPAARHVGIGCTAVIASAHPKKGAHRAYISACWDTAEVTHELVLEKGARTREQEEQLISSAALLVLERALTAPDGACGEGAQSIRAALAAEAGAGADAHGRERGPSARRALNARGDSYRLVRSAARPAPLERLLSGEAELVLCTPPAQRTAEGAPAGARGAHEVQARAWCDARVNGAIIFPGSFNPLHSGHARMASAAVEAAAQAGKGELRVVFEITARNADKGAVDLAELERRAAQFGELRGAGRGAAAVGAPVVLTQASLFVDKSRLFRNCTFVVGADTVARLVDTKYYNGSDAEMAASLAAIRATGSDLLVAGRLIGGKYTTLQDLLPAVPESLRPMFAPLEEDGAPFRVDISSTEIRQGTADPASYGAAAEAR